MDAGREFLDVDSTETIMCSLNETNHISWFNNKHQKINSTSEARMKANTNGKLTIQNVRLSDGGTYECRGLEYTRYYTIYVNGRPTYFYQAVRVYSKGCLACPNVIVCKCIRFLSSQTKPSNLLQSVYTCHTFKIYH